MLITVSCGLVNWLWLFVNDECVEHGTAEWAVPVAEVVIVLTFLGPINFVGISADLAFMHGLAPLFEKEKGDPDIESPFDGLRFVFLLGQQEVHGLFFKIELLVRLFDPFCHEAYGVG